MTFAAQHYVAISGDRLICQIYAVIYRMCQIAESRDHLGIIRCYMVLLPIVLYRQRPWTTDIFTWRIFASEV